MFVIIRVSVAELVQWSEGTLFEPHPMWQLWAGLTYAIPLPLHPKDVNNGTSEGSDGTLDLISSVHQ